MTFFQKIAIWIFIIRVKKHLIWIDKYEREALSLKQYQLIAKAYERLIYSIEDIYSWGKDLTPMIEFNSVVDYITHRLTLIKSKL